MAFSKLAVPGRLTLRVLRVAASPFPGRLEHASQNRRRSTLSRIWVPTGGVSAPENESGHGKLIRAGFLRQSQPGIFQLLPLGLRVQDKIEKLLDTHMQSLGASRLSLSSITTEELWRKSGRLDKVSPELFRFQDRRQMPFMLSPTHEEEITSLVASTLKSYKDLPLRLYQITRKYRDEMRPRHGLLRSREFIMKDLYTFDLSVESAVATYKDVSRAYSAFFADLKLPILVAEASSGDMGGSHSHEYHLANSIGEDNVATCKSCGYTANDEVAASRPVSQAAMEEAARHLTASDIGLWRGITKDRKTLVNAWYPLRQGSSDTETLNIHAVRSVVPDLDASVSDPMPFWRKSLRSAEDAAGSEASSQLRLLNVLDSRVATVFDQFKGQLPLYPDDLDPSSIPRSAIAAEPSGQNLNLVRLMHGDGCPRCEAGSLEIHKALELGHTFILGTRYSEPLDAAVALPQQPAKPVPLQMGCFGIGVSRILGTVAEHLSDARGLNWPRAIAPFEVIIIPTSGVNEQTLDFFDGLCGRRDGSSAGMSSSSITDSSSITGFDVVLDDRKESFGWKMQDADLTGYPVVIVLGKAWRQEGICEVQCRRLSFKENVRAEEVAQRVSQLLEQL